MKITCPVYLDKKPEYLQKLYIHLKSLVHVVTKKCWTEIQAEIRNIPEGREIIRKLC